MNYFIKMLIPFMDMVLVGPLALASAPFYLFARIGPRKLPKSRELLKSVGIFPIRDHYYQPLFQYAKLRHSPEDVRRLPGINMNIEGQLRFLSSLDYRQELISMQLFEPKERLLAFHFQNGSFESGDAEFLYQVIRHFKPRQIIEIGCGHSTKIACEALRKNNEEASIRTTYTCIEPYEAPWLEKLPVRVLRSPVEDCEMKMFEDLEEGDIVFIDSSHMIRPQGDVLFECLEILPTLKSGVIVHFHDIFTPRDYPEEWLREDVYLWNEQYIVEALLSNSDRYEVLASLNYLKHSHYDLLSKVCPYLEPNREPGSFYIRVK